MVTTHFPGRCIFGFSPQIMFSWCSLFHFPVFHGFWVVFYDLVEYLVHFLPIYYPTLQEFTLGLSGLKSYLGYIFRLALLSLRICWSMYSKSPFPLVLLWYLFCSWEKSLYYTSKWKITSLICAIRNFPT